MEKHIVIQILQDLDIKNESDVKKRVRDIDTLATNNLLNKMDDWYKQQRFQIQNIQNLGNSIFDFWIPSTPEAGINKVASNLLFANSVTLSDPLYDHLCFLESDIASKYTRFTDFLNNATNRKEHMCLDCLKQLEPIVEDVSREKLESILIFYVKSKPLIEDGRLIPYIDPTPRVRPIFDTPFVDIIRKFDKETDEFVSKLESARDHLFNTTGNGHFVNEISKPYLPHYIDIAMLETSALVGIDEVLSNEFIPSSSIDFLGHTSFDLFKAFYKLLQSKTKKESEQEFNPITVNHFSLPTLSGVDIREIPEILHKENNSLEQFKASLQSKVMAISSPYGSREWQFEIDKTRTQLQRDLIELQQTMTHIKNNYSAKQIANLGFMSFSLGIASLALLHQSIDPITAFQSVAGAAGLSTSMKNLIENWLEYRKDVSEQKRKDIYFLWRLGTIKKKAG